MIRTKRVYESPDGHDGFRVLVDGLWPRGLSHDKARVDLWLKQIAPSAELRKWFRHDQGLWSEFKRRYFDELDANAEAVEQLRSRLGSEDVTLLYAARDQDYNNAVCLSEYLAMR
ncbi:MAG: DUF488 family protein [Acidobacteria bacterium]|nr:DUF488 family protein [Acidobacteriota bacterium]